MNTVIHKDFSVNDMILLSMRKPYIVESPIESIYHTIISMEEDKDYVITLRGLILDNVRHLTLIGVLAE